MLHYEPTQETKIHYFCDKFLPGQTTLIFKLLLAKTAKSLMHLDYKQIKNTTMCQNTHKTLPHKSSGPICLQTAAVQQSERVGSQDHIDLGKLTN